MRVILKPIDIVFLIDVTGDMEPILPTVKARLKEMIDALSSSQLPTSWRARVVGFRDIYCDGDDWLVVHPFVHQNPDAILHQIDSLKASGGWDTRESLLDALLELIHWRTTSKDEPINESDWRHRSKANRYILLVTNADFHPSSKHKWTFEDMSTSLSVSNIGLMFVVPSSETYDEFESIPYSVCLARVEPPFIDNFKKSNEHFISEALRCMVRRYSIGVGDDLL